MYGTGGNYTNLNFPSPSHDVGSAAAAGGLCFVESNFELCAHPEFFVTFGSGASAAICCL